MMIKIRARLKREQNNNEPSQPYTEKVFKVMRLIKLNDKKRRLGDSPKTIRKSFR